MAPAPQDRRQPEPRQARRVRRPFGTRASGTRVPVGSLCQARAQPRRQPQRRCERPRHAGLWCGSSPRCASTGSPTHLLRRTAGWTSSRSLATVARAHALVRCGATITPAVAWHLELRCWVGSPVALAPVISLSKAMRSRIALLRQRMSLAGRPCATPARTSCHGANSGGTLVEHGHVQQQHRLVSAPLARL